MLNLFREDCPLTFSLTWKTFSFRRTSCCAGYSPSKRAACLFFLARTRRVVELKVLRVLKTRWIKVGWMSSELRLG